VANLLSSATCRRLNRHNSARRIDCSEELFGKAAEKDRLAACAPQTSEIACSGKTDVKSRECAQRLFDNE
jgi:hypothetical protein